MRFLRLEARRIKGIRFNTPTAAFVTIAQGRLLRTPALCVKRVAGLRFKVT